MTHTTSHDLMRQEPRLSRRKAIVCTAALSLAASAMLPHHAFGQDGLIKLVVGYPPGGASDRAARMVAERMQQILKRVIVVENRVGAGGRLAAQQLVNTPATTPKAVVDLLSKTVFGIMSEPATQARFASAKMVPVAMNQAQTAAAFLAFNVQWKPVIECSGFKPEA